MIEVRICEEIFPMDPKECLLRSKRQPPIKATLAIGDEKKRHFFLKKNKKTKTVKHKDI